MNKHNLMNKEQSFPKRLISGGGAAIGSLAGYAIAKWREAEVAYPYAVVGGLVGFATTELAMYLFAPSIRLREEIVRLVADEGRRLEKPVNNEHLMLALQRFNADQLRLFLRYVKAFIARDVATLQMIMPQWKAKMLPVIRESPEWSRYEGIIFGS
jgi:hypothetical protein